MTLVKDTDIYTYFSADLVGKPDAASVPQPTSLIIADIESVNSIGYVPHGEWEGRPYIHLNIKGGKAGGCVYGHYLEGTRMKEIADEIKVAVAA